MVVHALSALMLNPYRFHCTKIFMICRKWIINDEHVAVCCSFFFASGIAISMCIQQFIVSLPSCVCADGNVSSSLDDFNLNGNDQWRQNATDRRKWFYLLLHKMHCFVFRFICNVIIHLEWIRCKQGTSLLIISHAMEMWILDAKMRMVWIFFFIQVAAQNAITFAWCVGVVAAAAAANFTIINSMEAESTVLLRHVSY